MSVVYKMQDEIKQILKDLHLQPHKSDYIEVSGTPGNLLELWHESHKLSIYFEADETSVLRVWGSNMINEMSDHTLTEPNDINSHINWLRSS